PIHPASCVSLSNAPAPPAFFPLSLHDALPICRVTVELVLGGRGQRHLTRHVPNRATRNVPRVRDPVRVLRDPPTLNDLDLVEQFDIESLLVDHVALRIGTRHDDAPEFGDLPDRVHRHVARTGDHNLPPVEPAALGQHLVDEVRGAVTGGLGTHLGAAPQQPLAGEHAGLVPVGDALVLPEQITDLTLPDPDVAGWDIGV